MCCVVGVRIFGSLSYSSPDTGEESDRSLATYFQITGSVKAMSYFSSLLCEEGLFCGPDVAVLAKRLLH